MEMRKMEKLGIETSLLGFGCMRFPVLKNGRIGIMICSTKLWTVC
jgi:predicted aldo/keto reductase-like oxidoreductase